MFRVTVFAIKDATSAFITMRLNADSGANYAYQDILANSASVVGARTTGATSIALHVDAQVENSSSALFTIEIEKPLATTSARTTSSGSYLDTTGATINFEALSGEWANTADLITTITILASAGDFAIGSRVLVEGAQP